MAHGLRDRAMEDWFEHQREERRAELSRIAEQSAVQRGTDRSNPVRRMVEQHFKTVDTDAENVNMQPRPEPERPEAILVEVRGLFETRPVTNMLQSSRFRSQLERIVRASVVAARETRANSDPSIRAGTPPQVQQHQEQELDNQLRSYQEQHRQRLQHQQQRQQQQEQQHEQQRQQEQLHQQAQQQSQPQPPQAAPISYADTPYLQREPMSVVDSLLHEQIISDISELLHQGLVSTTLNSNFRDRLENLVGTQVNTLGGGDEALAALQQLPPSGHVRNDFTHLGLQIPEFNIDAETDSLSIVSAQAAAVPFSHTSIGMGRELAKNREEMRAMRDMLKMVFDMQADLKRTIQQEVAAAMASAAPAATSRPAPPASTPFTAGQCLICLSAAADTIAYRCGHLCMCYGCSVRLSQHQSSRQTCPVCRAPVQDFVRIYKCSENSQ